MYKQIFTLLIFLFFNTSAHAQVFSKFYDYKGINDLGTDVLIVDSGYLLVSPSIDFSKVDTLNYSQTFQYFVYINNFGEIIKERSIRIPYNALDNNGRSLIKLNDSIYLNIGIKFDLVKYKQDTIGSDIHLIKFNLNLDTISTKTIVYGTGNEAAVGNLKSSDGNIIIFGQNCTQGRPIQDCNYFLMKLDSNLNVLWTNSYTYGATYFENPTAFVETEDKGFLLFGYTGKYTSQLNQVRHWYLVKTDSLGNKQWQKIFNKNNYDFGFDIIKTLSGDYILSGSVETIITGGVKETQGWLMKINPSGQMIWETITGSERDDYYYRVVELKDSTIIVVGHQISERVSVNDVDAWLLKFDKNGKKLWERIYNNYSVLRHKHPSDLIYSMQITEDNGFIMVGWSYNPDLLNPTQDVWLLKVDSFGCLVPGCQGVGIDGKRISTEEVIIFPNPAVEHINLKHREKIKYYQILDAQAKVVQKGSYSEEGIQLNVELAKGAYLLHVEFESGTQGFGKLLLNR